MPYGFIITFNGSFSGKEQKLVTATQGRRLLPGPRRRLADRGQPESLRDKRRHSLSMNITKSGAGTLTLGGNNTYKGTTTVSQGILKVISNNALGQPLGQNSGNTIVNTGAELQVATGVSIGNEGLQISGGGYAGSVNGSGSRCRRFARAGQQHRVGRRRDADHAGGQLDDWRRWRHVRAEQPDRHHGE